MLEASVKLEKALDRVILRLSKAGATKETKALLVDARRLRAVVGNWRTIAPTTTALAEMAQRVDRIVRAADAAAPHEPAAPSDDEQVAPGPGGQPVLISRAKEEPARFRTLPDLDIRGVPQLVGEGAQGRARPLGSGIAFETDAGLRPVARGRAAPEPARPSPEPAGNGGRRPEPDPTDRSDRSRAVRPSRILADQEDGDDGSAGPVYGAGSAHAATPVDEDSPPGRQSPKPQARSSSAPPALKRSEKTSIAVRPLPAPEVLDKRLVLLTEPYSERADAYRSLRRKLSGPGSPKTIAITSAQPEEGKTSCAANLALAFRETSSERVLLVEANLRTPGLAKIFGFETPACFAKQMARNRDASRATWTVVEQFEPLHVLAVDPASRTSPMLDPVAFANALEKLVEAGYDHIIVDTPAALGGSDVNLVADAVDGIVVVAWIKKSKRSLIKKAIDQLKPATILGVVTLEG